MNDILNDNLELYRCHLFVTVIMNVITTIILGSD